MPGVALFVYGTLMDAGQVLALTGRRFPTRPARLGDFERLAPAGGYPYVVSRAGAHVDGLLLEDVDPASLRALDRYEEEGRLYVRRPVEVLADGVRLACETYVGATIRGAPARE
ncbi:MAG TPA: gamma-glutamylcyclotransferase family protein [Candidatus Binatia bacterium]|nr:gamma-glutamylcyclotransferase family protein [Candidatus Binatia bacterium]